MPYLTISTDMVPSAAQMNANWRDQVVTQCTNATRPTGVDGMLISVTDLDTVEVWDGSAWKVLCRYAADWVSFTPTLTATTTSPTLGTGSSAVGRYQRVGNTVNYAAKITFGSSGVVAGSGSYLFSLPLGADLTLNVPIGRAIVYDSSANTHYVGAHFPDTQMVTHASTVVTNSAPIAWAASDYISVAGTYEL